MSTRARSMVVLLLLTGCRQGWHDDLPLGPGGHGRGHPEPHPGRGGPCPGGPGGEGGSDGGAGRSGTGRDGGGAGTGGSAAPAGAGYCTSDVACGGGLACDR